MADNKLIALILYFLIIINLYLFANNLLEADRLDRVITLNNLTIDPDEFLYGYYFHDKYYCVWTKYTFDKQIISTEVHEQCHELVFYNKSHFCY